MTQWMFLLIWLTVSVAFADRSLIQTLDCTLNELSSLQARFSHTDSTGKFYKGTLFLKRPWKLRMQYDAPSPFLIVSNGDALIYEDHVTHEATYLPLEASPLSFLLAKKTNLTKVLKIDNMKERDDEISFSCRDKKNYFTLDIVFSKKEKSIIGWISKDAQGNEVKINLHAIQRNVPLTDNLFHFQQKPRWLTKSKERK